MTLVGLVRPVMLPGAPISSAGRLARVKIALVSRSSEESGKAGSSTDTPLDGVRDFAAGGKLANATTD